MKNVVFYIGYQGIIDIEDVLKLSTEIFRDSFKSYDIAFPGKIEIELYQMQEISAALSIPVKEIKNQKVHRFSNNTFGTDVVTLDICKYYAALNVVCTNYQTINEYLIFFSKLTDFLFDVNNYFSVKMIGLRKIGGKVFLEKEKIFKEFEAKYFKFDFAKTPFNSVNNHYSDILKHSDNGPVINYIRSFQTGLYRGEDDVDREAYQILLIIEGIYSEEILESINFERGKIRGLLEDMNHIHMFNLFKMSVTNDFLKKHSE